MRILVIDDEEGIRASLADILSVLGGIVTTAANGVNGLEVFRHSVGFDLVFTDRTMPGGILGEEVVREIKRLSPETFIVLMSGDESKEVERVGKAAGADKILFKPFHLTDVQRVFKEVATG